MGTSTSACRGRLSLETGTGYACGELFTVHLLQLVVVARPSPVPERHRSLPAGPSSKTVCTDVGQILLSGLDALIAK